MLLRCHAAEQLWLFAERRSLWSFPPARPFLLLPATTQWQSSLLVGNSERSDEDETESDTGNHVEDIASEVSPHNRYRKKPIGTSLGSVSYLVPAVYIILFLNNVKKNFSLPKLPELNRWPGRFFTPSSLDPLNPNPNWCIEKMRDHAEIRELDLRTYAQLSLYYNFSC